MSHSTTIKTKLVAKEPLQQALADVSSQFGLGTVQENAVVHGYGGNTTRADLVVTTRNRGYDIGFKKSGDTYDLVADWWGIKNIDQKALTQRLQQRYAYHAVKSQLDQQRFNVVEETVEADQTVRLVVRRVV